MKNLILSFLALLLVNVVIAQDLSAVVNHNDSSPQKSEAKSEKAALSEVSEAEVTAIHSQSAGQQLSAHLKKSIIYTKNMQDYCVEQSVEVEVTINKKGEIANYKVIGNPHPDINRIVNEAMKEIKSIKVKDHNYRGVKKMRIPINFKLT